jgi:hypothetical protein
MSFAVTQIDLPLHSDGQCSGDQRQTPVGVGSCVLFEKSDGNSYGLVRAFVFEEGELWCVLQLLDAAEDVLPIAARPLLPAFPYEFELVFLHSRTMVPVCQILSLVQLFDEVAWQWRFGQDSPAAPIPGVHFYAKRHFNLDNNQVAALQLRFLWLHLQHVLLEKIV